MRSWLVLLLVGSMSLPAARLEQTAPAPSSNLEIDTAKGTIEIQLFRADAPKSTDRIVELAKSGFYRGLRLHRVTSQVAQFGDPLTRDMSKKAYWGSGGSGRPIGVAEISKKRTHLRGTVGLASAGAPEIADSQLYIMKIAAPGLDGKYAIVGQVTKGMDVVDKLQVGDVIKVVTLK